MEGKFKDDEEWLLLDEKPACRICFSENIPLELAKSLNEDAICRQSWSTLNPDSILYEKFLYPSHICEVCLNVVQAFLKLKRLSEKHEKILQEHQDELETMGLSNVKLMYLNDVEQVQVKVDLEEFNLHEDSLDQEAYKDDLDLSEYDELKGSDNGETNKKFKGSISKDDFWDGEDAVKKKRGRKRKIEPKPETKVHVCEHCGFISKTKKYLKQHVNDVHANIVHSCDQCNYTTKRKDCMRNHKNNVHSDQTHLCSLCGYESKSRNNLWKHNRSVHGDSIFKCEQCDYSTTTMENLKRHGDSVHLKIRFPCEHCGKTVGSKGKLKLHIMSSHENVRHQCDQCECRFTQKYKLRQHIMRVHEKIKHHCDQCDHVVNDKEKLKLHIAAVHNNKRFSCDQCDHTVLTKKTLLRHVQSIHQKIRYYCDHCEYSSTRPETRNAHMKSAHGDTTADVKAYSSALSETIQPGPVNQLRQQLDQNLVDKQTSYVNINPEVKAYENTLTNFGNKNDANNANKDFLRPVTIDQSMRPSLIEHTNNETKAYHI